MCHINYLSFSSGLILLVLGFVFANFGVAHTFWGYSVAETHNSLEVVSHVRIVLPLHTKCSTKTKKDECKRLTTGTAFKD